MAINLGKQGCKLSLVDINMEWLNDTKKILEQDGVSSTAINLIFCDLTKLPTIKDAAA